MTRILVRMGLIAALVGGLLATPALASKASGTVPGSLVVVDTAKVFTEGGINKAKDAFAAVKFSGRTNLTVETFPEIPAERKAAYDAASDKKKFFHDWAKGVYKSHDDSGVYVLICMKPGHVEVITGDKTAERRGFTNDDSNALAKKFLNAFRAAKGKPEAEAKATHDKGLLEGTDYVISQLKGTQVGNGDSGGHAQRSGGMGIIGWVCVGLFALLGIWLVIGLIRMFTGGGGGGGMGGGGGGFFTSLLGGLFGAAAGMWMYNHFFGGGGGMFGGSDAYAGDGGGGDYGGGDIGGEDVSGDYGGGGDFDGGGGDFGGGDF